MAGGVRSIGWWMLGASVALTGLALALALANEASAAGDLDLAPATVATWGGGWLAFAVAGAVILSRLPNHRIGLVLAGVALLNALGIAVYAYAERAVLAAPGSLPAAEAALWLSNWIVIPPVPLLAILGFLMFPSGSPLSPRWRWVGRVGVLAVVLVAAHAALAPGTPEGGLGANPYPVKGADALAAAWPVVSACVLLAVISLVLRYRRGSPLERQQIRWIALGGVLLVVAFIGDSIYSAATEGSELLPLPIGEIGLAMMAAGIAIAVLRYRLYDLDLVVNRTLVYGLLTALVVAGYIGVVTGLGELADSTGIGVSLVATALVAVAIQPARAIVQRRVDRLMYGDREDPYRALSRLGERLGAALDPDAVLPAAVDAIAEGLRLPYVAIELEEEGRYRVAASHGEPRGGEPARLPLEYRGEAVGRLVAYPRPGSSALGAADLALLADLARQAGVAAHAVRLTHDLRHSRERLVSAREEERRRLRRDLHDGLGPALAAIALEIEVARAHVDRDPGATRDLLARLRGEVQEAIADIRRIAYDLRPPTLDELGLVGALREQAARLGSAADRGVRGVNGLRVSVSSPERLPPLPAAVEVAAYRIALEALTNVSRHAGASTCSVTVAVNGALELEVADDGSGIDREAGGGVGLLSMRERAEELGGSLSIDQGPGGHGTVVRARLPVDGG